MGEVGVVMRIDQRLLQPTQQQMHVEDRHIAAEHDLLVMHYQRGILDLRVVEPVRARPGVPLKVIDALRLPQRPGRLLVVDARFVGN